MASDNNDSLSYLNLAFLTFQAVFQTIIICTFGYLAARSKILTPTVQRHISTLNVELFTPCLIFSKLASSLSLEALVDIAIIPVFFVITTVVSISAGKIASRLFRLNVREKNFVTAMAVFGNSNSLPVSLSVALAYTLPNLRWPDIPNDNADDVASRAILYLLVFQQLGQILRWSWGYNTLLAKPPRQERQLSAGTEEEEEYLEDEAHASNGVLEIPDDEESQLLGHPHPTYDSDENERPKSFKSQSHEDTRYSSRPLASFSVGSSTESLTQLVRRRTFPMTSYSTEESTVSNIAATVKKVYRRVLAFMNIPLWAMLVSIIVASIPPVREEMFEKQGFIQNTVTKSIQQLGGVAIPMILVVLGSNLAPDSETKPSQNYSKIVAASLLSRMILPPLIMLPIIACSVKFINISILDDPVFLLVAFILTIAPPAIQLSQICQINRVFEREMAGVLFWGYVVLTLPSTIFIVLTSIEVLDWAGTTRA